MKKIFMIMMSCAVLAIAGCTTTPKIMPEDQTAQTTTKVSVAGVKSFAGALFYIAQKQGFFAEQGLELTTTRMAGGDEVFKALTSKSVNVGVVGIVPYGFAALQFPDIKLITVIGDSPDTRLIARKDVISQGSDLKGKKIAYKKTTASDIALEQILTNYNLTINDIQAIDMSPAGMATAFAQGEVDAYVIRDPIAYNGMKLAGFDKVREFKDPQDVYTWYISLFADKAYIDDNKDALKKMIAALQDAEQYIQTNLSESQAIVAETLSLPIETVQTLWPTYFYKVGMRSNTNQVVDGLLKWAAEKKGMTGSLHSDDLIYEVR